MNKFTTYIVLGALILGVLITFLWFRAKKLQQIKLPNSGGGIPQGWSALSVANQLHSLCDGIDWGNTNEDDIYTLIMALTNDQLAAVYNQYIQTFNENLQTVLNDEIGDSTMLQAINQRFNTIIN